MSTDPGAPIRAAVHGRDQWCRRCGSAGSWDGLHIHHRRGRGGADPNRMSNLILLCAPCHRHVHAQPNESYATGWLVSRYDDDPEEVPLVTLRGEQFFLLDDGSDHFLTTAPDPWMEVNHP